eukprot:CAMPEP_0118976370 /NCGR_PEP_ID=MMETSP1173-20130426/18627_1 /TAXON_ID=1034831 /ORGANISM="Rhizochromulina marina cf, Strain CCMP1243" /LENGTH=59 /DNA_ID=CAMNT_0006926395 /DNA_START=22 /DNA_END=198 /DNA_ORIENTATION=-
MRDGSPRRRVGTPAAIEAVENGGLGSQDRMAPSTPGKQNNDAASIALLCVLYTLQGIPM